MSTIHSSVVRVVSIASIRRASMVICLTSLYRCVVVDDGASPHRCGLRRREQYREALRGKRYRNRARWSRITLRGRGGCKTKGLTMYREAFGLLICCCAYSSDMSTPTGSLRNGLGAPSPASGGGGGGGSNPAGGSISISEYR